MYRFARQSLALCGAAALLLAIGSPAPADAEENAPSEKAAQADSEANAPGAKAAEAGTDEAAQQAKPTAKKDGTPQRRGGRPRQGRGPAFGFPPGMAELRLVNEMSAEIGVDEELSKKLDVMAKEFRAEESRLTEEMREATTKVSKLLDTGRPGDKAVIEAATAASAVARETRLNRLRLTLKLRSLLTDEQLAKFMEMRTKAMKARKGKGKGRQGQPGK